MSFGEQNHIRNRRHKDGYNYNRGTWRTRMKRTKCWRCELESRRTASTKALHRFKRKLLCDGDAWEDWWVRVRQKLEWTCLCRYRGYEDDDDESAETVRRNEERARLGRMGGEMFT